MTKNPRLILIGASAGGVPAIHRIIPELPSDFQTPLVVLLHLPPTAKVDFEVSYARNTKLKISEIEDKMPIENGTVYFAPPAYHTLVEKEFFFSLSLDEPVHFSRPSIDVLFQSAADALADEVVGVLLTGANEDGAQGLKSIQEAGGIAIVENPETAEVPTMPKAALKLLKPDHLVSVPDLAGLLQKISRGEVR